MTDALVLSIISFLTSTVAAIVGIGGGMMLIAILPSFLPTNALIPIHGMTQLSSNLSRAYFGFKYIKFEIMPQFLLGSFVGILLFASIIYFISLDYVPLFVGIYILLSLWSEKFNERLRKYESFFWIGFFQTGLSMVVGATGPLSMAILLKKYQDKHIVVATGAAMMSITHILKVFVFIFFGFVFSDYILVLIFMIVGAVSGSYIGTKLRDKVDGKKFVTLLKILLSALAIKIIVGVIFL